MTPNRTLGRHRREVFPGECPVKMLLLAIAPILFLSACADLDSNMNNAQSDHALETTASSSIAQDLLAVSPALAGYAERFIEGDLWKRAGLSPRDRSIVTISVLIARNQQIDLPDQIERALMNGVKPAEISEIITHLAFYSGWSNASSAARAARPVFERRGVDTTQLPPLDPLQRLPLDQAKENVREQRVSQDFGAVAPGVVQYTRELLFRDLWLRPGLAPRDRSLVTVSALVGSGQVAQAPYHLNRAMDNGLTEVEASEMLTQLAFYAGWPNVFSALPVFKEVFASRAGVGEARP